MKFIINKYLVLKLEKGETHIYVKNEFFRKCKYLLLVNPQDKKRQDQINSIDEAADILRNTLETELTPKDLGITPEVEFWGHSSNLQTWAEYDYDTRLLHSNLAFPLLKKLTEVGDPKAKRIFTEEIASRFEKGTVNTITYIIINRYLDYLDKSELENLLDSIPNMNTIEINNFWTWVDLGNILYKKGLYEKAYWAYNRAIKTKFLLFLKGKKEMIRLSKDFPIIDEFKEEILEKYKKIFLIFSHGCIYQDPEILIPLIIYLYLTAQNVLMAPFKLIEKSKITETQFLCFESQLKRRLKAKQASKISES